MIEYDLLPASMQRLADEIGLDGTLVIIKAYQNSVLNVPHNHPTKRLIELLGIETASLFVQEYRQISLPIPECKKLSNYLRSLEILKLKDEGMSILELCKLYGLSRRCVFKSLADARIVVESLARSELLDN